MRNRQKYHEHSVTFQSLAFAFVFSFVFSFVVASGCSSLPQKPAVAVAAAPKSTDVRLIRSDYVPGEVTRLCDEAIVATKARLEAIAKIPAARRNVDNTLLALESALADFGDRITPLTFMAYVSTDKEVSKEASACEERTGQFAVDVGTRRDLYDAVKDQKGRDADEERLAYKTIQSFEHNGLKLPDEQLAKAKALMMELAKKESQFSTNLNQDTSTVTFKPGELNGVPSETMARFKKAPDGGLVVTTKSTDYESVMENAKNENTRRKMMLAHQNRAYPANMELLREAVAMRAKIAAILGYRTWADYKTALRMAKNEKTVMDFLHGLESKLARRNKEDLAKLLKFKRAFLGGAKGVSEKDLNAWDTLYYAYQLKKRDYSLDDEQIREYFPADVVIAGLFKVYSTMLGVNFVEVPNAKVWADHVKLYEIRNSSDHRLIGYFYTDFVPREGKYGHAAAFPLISGRRLDDGGYSKPVAAIVANLTPPSGGRPSLLTHDEVETIFHEFGHIMHQTLTKAPYASLSGSSVPQDFVEAPSQMLENWVWSPQILSQLSGRYDNHAKKLPPKLLKKMIAARDFNQGVFYTRQLLFGLYDMTMHTQPEGASVDPTKTFDELYAQIIGQRPLEGGHFGASFGHLMSGYDAAYYGYLWSQVYAQDMFSKFRKNDLMNPAMGSRYRKAILERGDMRDPIDSLRDFLGREPNSKAFFRKLHIK